VRAPTLLIVGGDDTPVIALNRKAFAQMRCTKDFVIVPGATHLFEEPGTLEDVMELARMCYSSSFQERGKQRLFGSRAGGRQLAARSFT